MCVRLASVSFACLAISCATLPSTGGGDEHLPNAAAGPFREIAQEELGNARVAPYVMNDEDVMARDVSILDLDGDPTTLSVAGYFAATLSDVDPPDVNAKANAILMFQAIDGRSFDRFPVTVLEPEATWEGDTVSAPSVIRVGTDVWLYYAAAGGIGLARSADGAVFVREPMPVLSAATGTWEDGSTPTDPSVIQGADGTFHLFYGVAFGGGHAIGEAVSADGLQWQRVADEPVLAPRAASDATSEPPYDEVSVASPVAVMTTSSTGRALTRLYYTARDRSDRQVIGLAAREGEEGAFGRGVSPVFGTQNDVRPDLPCVLVYPSFTLLFVTEFTEQGHPAVVAGVAPADTSLPPPEPR